ncbi:MAG: ribonuclease D [Micavibrio aeruginosavorus]|uniref:Ribonuclease D n=1 Tax=Micavibrio aeruginosavorus TaxID=349221 RepID=A0A7T5UHG6_9BACT|nr:MAG: ribonuclease D [Micavibrio aeruginosavorus]
MNSVIHTQAELEALCAELAQGPYFTIDTEFLRDKTYYPQLCLIQVASPEGEPRAIDPLMDGIDLQPLFALLADEKTVKVFHAARQDLEIFYNLTGKVPHPIFDTQVAAMVCGFGESIGYYSLVADICGVHLDKGAQFTDWSRRPLSKKQLIYALDDVTYLRDIYEELTDKLNATGRATWLAQEMDILTSDETYLNRPEDSWERIKVRTDKPKVLAVLREVSAWREREAQNRDVPRQRIVKDEVLADMAVHPPETSEELGKIRGLSPDFARGRMGKALLEAVHKGLATPPKDCPRLERRPKFPSDMTPTLEMLKMLLRIQCAEHGVAPKLIANSDDLEAFVINPDGDLPVTKGWRGEIFGDAARRMMAGKIALCLKNKQISRIEL